ncbi:MAG: sigma-70 family RNA polymerase sigma factor [Clostridiales bacterium]|nr:sigma-70 family RNA polymerase sigma factor [Clostridiales bacterium]
MEIKMLVKKAKAGDKEALLQLIMKEHEKYYKLAYVYTKNPEDAMDALEDMIVILYNKINTLRKEDAFYSWSKTILVNSCKKILKRRNKLLYLDQWEQPDDRNSIKNSEEAMDLEGALNKLNEHQREAIKLRYYLDYDYKSIANITNVSLGTVKSRISTGIKKLKNLLIGGEV